MGNIVERFQALKTKREGLLLKKSSLQGSLESDEKRYKEGMQKLKEEFGLNSLREAKEELDRVKVEIENITNDLDKQMQVLEQEFVEDISL